MTKTVSAREAAALIRDGSTILVSGNGEILMPDRLLEALEERFLMTGSPRDLTLAYNVIPGAQREGTGVDRLAHEGMVRRVIAGSYRTLKVQRLGRLVQQDRVEAYLVPFGALYNMVRTAAAGQPGVLTPVGVGTIVDPRLGGGRLTPSTKQDLVRLMPVDGEEYLFYPALPADVAIIRATTADEDGNLSIEQEPNSVGILHQAMAAKNRGGLVVAQVRQLASRGSINPRSVVVPGVFVDQVVVVPDQMDAMPYNPAWTGDIRVPADEIEPLPLDHKKVIARRAAMELRPDELVNFGFGVSASVPRVAAEEGIADRVTFNVEHGPVGGIPNNKLAFGAGINMAALMDAPAIFDFYDGGRLDMTCLGMAEVDAGGNLNVHHVGGHYNLGGFIDIVHAAKRIVFCGTFSAGGLSTRVGDGMIEILQEGRHTKFVDGVEEATFDAAAARRKGQSVLYITERAVFSLTEEGLTLTEVAPGVDPEDDVLEKMRFRPAVAQPLTLMDERIFCTAPLGLSEAAPFGPKPRGRPRQTASPARRQDG